MMRMRKRFRVIKRMMMIMVTKIGLMMRMRKIFMVIKKMMMTNFLTPLVFTILFRCKNPFFMIMLMMIRMTTYVWLKKIIIRMMLLTIRMIMVLMITTKWCKFYKGWLKKIKEDEKPPMEEEKPVKKRFKISHDKNIPWTNVSWQKYQWGKFSRKNRLQK